MPEKKTGGPAFPRKTIYGRCEACGWDENSSVPGMTLRDYFAAKAMQGLVVPAFKFLKEAITEPDEPMTTAALIMVYDISGTAYKIADAMIQEREK